MKSVLRVELFAAAIESGKVRASEEAEGHSAHALRRRLR